MTRCWYPLDVVRQLYAERVRQFGQDPQALYWKGRREQYLRLEVLADIEPCWENQSVLDVGCGFCDLVDVLRGRGFNGRYVGVDICDEVLRIGRARYPDLEILNRDILAEPFNERFDYVMASGTFNIRFCEDMPEFVDTMLKAMFDRARVGVAVNYLSTYVDFRHPQAHHTDPAHIFHQAKMLTRRVLLRSDYMAYEFTLYLWRDDRIGPGHVFAAYNYYKDDKGEEQ